MVFELKCSKCRRKFDLKVNKWRCDCGSPLNLEISEYPKVENFSELIKDGQNIWRYSALLPFKEGVTLGEGLTPVLNKKIAEKEVFFKLEYFSPTGSFKDRGAALGVTRAKEIGVRTIVEDSSGNAGLSYSAYAASANIKARIYVPFDAPIGKRALMRACNAEVVECKTREEASLRAISELKNDEIYVGHTWDPFFLEGMKTEAFEIFEEKIQVDSVIVPTSSGSHLLGIYRGFEDLVKMGFLDEYPEFYAVQAGGITPIYDRIYGEWRGEKGDLADGLRILQPPRLDQILDTIKRTNGDVVVVDNEEIISGMKELYQMGLIVEPTSATAYAALKKIRDVKNPLVPLTGTGIKTVDKIEKIINIPL
ncbi:MULTISPECIES: threonine synthase [unclassified Archaeoglobus]|jgi:threonine synthase|uniref:threonine synthase n=1 Tax=unclassified Archaeoglobus TaxID=2643606 RepID=UPI0025BC9F0B|nr:MULTISPECIES: pyridoxal-phosphate dependent enzyme [unclassified Archaeoglobus]